MTAAELGAWVARLEAAGDALASGLRWALTAGRRPRRVVTATGEDLRWYPSHFWVADGDPCDVPGDLMSLLWDVYRASAGPEKAWAWQGRRLHPDPEDAYRMLAAVWAALPVERRAEYQAQAQTAALAVLREEVSQ